MQHLFEKYPGQIACVILEPSKYDEPEDHFLHRVKELCQRYGAIFILDEMITGFRLCAGGAQDLYDIEPDLSTFGKAFANGFSVSALAGKREFMELGGLYHDRDRVFLLSTTHGAETHALEAAIATMQCYQQLPVVETMARQGAKLKSGIDERIASHGLEDYVQILGHPANLVFATRDEELKPSQGYRTLLMQELIKHGVLGPSLVVSFSHDDDAIQQTISAFDLALDVYRQALQDGYASYLVGRTTQTVYQRKNSPAFSSTARSRSRKRAALMQVATEQLPATDESCGAAMHALASRLFPLHRAQSGSGVRESLALMQEHIPLQIHEVASGTEVFDWQVPLEWRIQDAYVADRTGRRVIDYRSSNLHVVNGSRPVHETLSFAQLRPHLHTLPDHPEWIPYRTCFMRDDWGFCLTQDQLDLMAGDPQREFEVVIDSSFHDGSLTYGELFLPGRSDREMLIYTHTCHPSLANDNLSGIVVATFLAKQLISQTSELSLRFVFAPATIGAITWLAQNVDALDRIDHGLVLSLLGNDAPFTYKQSRRGNASIDRAAEHLFVNDRFDGSSREFTPFGYDERQFCSPGINLPLGCLMRTPNAEFPEYHTSADDLSFIRPSMLAESLQLCAELIEMLGANHYYVNTSPMCEPKLGSRGIERSECNASIPWLLNLADGQHDLLDICEKSKHPFADLRQAARVLAKHDLIVPLAADTSASNDTLQGR